MLICFLFVSCTVLDEKEENSNEIVNDIPEITVIEYSTAYFAGGCFWCVEAAFEEVGGVIEVYSGFSGGEEVDPSYKDVSSGSTGHAETVQVIYDPLIVSYEELVHVLLLQIDPTDATGSFVDRGNQYRSAIFYSTDLEYELAEKTLSDLESLELFGDEDFAVELLLFDAFYLAEDYHQNYHTVNPVRYTYYRSRSGRDQFLEGVWTQETLDLFENFLPDQEISEEDVGSSFVKPSDEQLKEMLTDMQYEVTQEDGTERSFTGEYDGFYEAGIYVDVVSGEALFSSIEKYDSGTGWPSFYAPLVEENIVLVEDKGIFGTRTEVRSKLADSHLGHVFDDGPEPTGLRYCMNSAALRFVPVEDLEIEGYGEFLELFE